MLTITLSVTGTSLIWEDVGGTSSNLRLDAARVPETPEEASAILPGLTFSIDGVPVWNIGLDSTTLGKNLAIWSVGGDKFQMGLDGRFVIGNGATDPGTTKAGAQFRQTLTATHDSDTLYGGYVRPVFVDDEYTDVRHCGWYVERGFFSLGSDGPSAHPSILVIQDFLNVASGGAQVVGNWPGPANQWGAGPEAPGWVRIGNVGADPTGQWSAQQTISVVIGGPLAARPSPDVILELSSPSSTPKAFLPPRLTTTQRDAIAHPCEGMYIHNTTTHRPNVYDGTAWVALAVES